MDLQTSTELLSNLNSHVAKMSNMNEIANGHVAKGNAEISVPVNKVGRKNLKAKTTRTKQKKSENITEDDASQTTADVNTNREQNKNRKRKAATVEQLEDSVEEEAEDNANADGATDSEENKNGRGENPKRKSARKEKSENVSGQNMKGDSSTVDENATDVKVRKKESAKNSTGKAAVHPPISEMVLESFRALRKRNGTSAEDISNYIEANFQVNIKRIKPHIKKFLQKGVAEGLFDQVNGSGDDGKLRVKKTTKVKDETGKSKKTKTVKQKEVKKVAVRTKKEAGKVSRKIKNDKMRPKKRVGA